MKVKDQTVRISTIIVFILIKKLEIGIDWGFNKFYRTWESLERIRDTITYIIRDARAIISSSSGIYFKCFTVHDLK